MKKLVIGGQAVMEGVLMRSPNFYSVAVRKPDDSISVKTVRHKAYTKRNMFLGFPLIRGIAILLESVVIGTKALLYSANESGESDEKFTTKELVLTITLSIIAALLIFKFVPLFLANFLSNRLGLGNFWFNIADGVIKIIIFMIYLWLLSQMSDMKRIFQYHGAEHMSVHCYEHGEKLTVENVRKYKTMHPRCGTEFLLLVLVVSILIYMFIPFGSSIWMKYIFRILLLPLIAGVSYEILKFSGLNYDNWFAKFVASPGMLLQRITTAVPSDDQIEVAIKSLKATLKKERG